MTGNPSPDSTERRASYDAFRDGFGEDLVGATSQRERVPRRRRGRLLVVAVPVLAAALAALAFVRLPAPGSTDGPVFGANDAVAAVRELRASLERGVLVRAAENAQWIDGRIQRSTVVDWTDLKSRARRTRFQGGFSDSEFWDVSLHERFEQNQAWVARDGRAVVLHTVDPSTEIGTVSESPAEEVARLVRLAQAGELSLRRTGGRQVIERTEGCYANAAATVMECPDPERPSAWPGKAPRRMSAVTSFETWWLSTGTKPRLLRYENGVMPVAGKERHVRFRTRYSRWEVLATTPGHLALVAPPAFPASDFLVLEGGDAVSRGFRNGTVRCTLKDRQRC